MSLFHASAPPKTGNCRWVLVCFFVLIVLPTGAWACVQTPDSTTPTLKLPHKFKENLKEQGYIYQVLKLALDKSAAVYGPCEIDLIMNQTPIRRLEFFLEEGEKIHINSFTVSEDRNDRFRVIPIPLTKGLVGNRFFLIRKGDTKRFRNIRSPEDLRQFTAGQGLSWTDTYILKANQLPVRTTKNVDSLINMLTHNRFDYLPRGAHEVRAELAIYQDKAIELEPNLVLSYPLMTAFYVNRKNSALAQRIAYGLNQAIDDGSFDALFYSHPTMRYAIEDKQLGSRNVIYLCNPFVPVWVPVKEDKYWYRPWPESIKNDIECKSL